MKHNKKLLVLLLASTLSADQFSVQLYNDFFAGTDRHFTNGVAVSWMDDTYEHKDANSLNIYSDLILGTFDLITPNGIDTSKRYSTGASIAQMMLTPTDTTLSTTQYDDVPYVGYLALNLYLFEWDDDNFNEYRIEFGVIGENAGGEVIQNGFHNLIGNDKLNGWDTQMGTKYMANALYRRGNISWKTNKSNILSMDWFNHFGFNLGNYTIDTFGGTMFRMGSNYIQNFNVHYPYLKEEAILLEVDKKNHGFGWSLSTGINGSAVAYSYIVEQSKKDGYEVDSRSISASVYVGVEFLYNVHKLSYFYQSQSPYNKKQTESDIYGSFVYSYQF